MKCSDYLWKFIDLQARMGQTEGWSPERTQGELRLAMEANGDHEIVSDTTGQEMTEREARAVLGRNEHELRRAYEMGRKGIFTRICEGQQISDDEWEAAKGDTEETADNGNG